MHPGTFPACMFWLPEPSTRSLGRQDQVIYFLHRPAIRSIMGSWGILRELYGWRWGQTNFGLRYALKSESVSHSIVSDSLWPMDWSLPGSSVHGILQARILQWVAIPFSRGSSRPRDRTRVSCLAGRFFTVHTTWGTHWGSYMTVIHFSVSEFWWFVCFEELRSIYLSCHVGEHEFVYTVS